MKEAKNVLQNIKDVKQISDEIDVLKAKKISESKKFYRSKKFWVSICAFTVPVVNSTFSLGLEPEVVGTLLAPLAAYVIGQGISDKR